MQVNSTNINRLINAVLKGGRKVGMASGECYSTAENLNRSRNNPELEGREGQNFVSVLIYIE